MNSVDAMDMIQEQIIEIGEKYEYTSKVYNILAIALVRAGKLNNADKIFRKALSELKILEKLESNSSSEDDLSLLQNFVRYGTRDKDWEIGREYLLK